jgi:hypothetical protein
MRSPHTEAISALLCNVATRVAACLVLPLVGSLAACSIGQTDPASTNLRVFSMASAADQAVLRPDYTYLRVHLTWQAPLLVRGYWQQDPDGGQTETWYSAGAEVLRIKDGRMLSTAGLRTDWSAVRYGAVPTWSQAVQSAQTYTYTRQRDQMPGYHFGIQETLQLRPVNPPGGTELKGINPQTLRWFEETVVQVGSGVLLPLPPTRYAVQWRQGQATVVYADQCLAPDLCFSWQRWPAQS